MNRPRRCPSSPRFARNLDGLAREGLKRFNHGAEIYIRPMYWAEEGAPGGVRPDPESTRWCLTLYVAPFPKPTGTAITLSPYPSPDARDSLGRRQGGLVYPNNARSVDRGAWTRLRQLSVARHAWQYRRAWHGQYLHGQGWCRAYAGAEGTFRRHHARPRYRVCCARPTPRWSRRCCAIPISSRPTRFFRPATTPKWRRSRASMSGIAAGSVFRRARELYWEYAHADAC